MRLILQKNKEEKELYLDKSFLIFRPNDFPLYLKPIKTKVDSICAITGKLIMSGDYAYPCHTNPLRLSPYGPQRCLIGPALQKGDAILPAGYWACHIPTTEALKGKIHTLDRARNKELQRQATKLLKGGGK